MPFAIRMLGPIWLWKIHDTGDRGMALSRQAAKLAAKHRLQLILHPASMQGGR